MIKSENGETIIEGNGLDIAINLNGIFKAFVEAKPAFLIGTVLAWSEELKAASLEIDDVEEINAVAELSKSFIRHHIGE